MTSATFSGFCLGAGVIQLCKSVFLAYQSLLSVKISLFLIVGNLAKNLDDQVEICSASACIPVDSAKFPVKFPVSREWRAETGPICTGSPANQCGLSNFR